MFLITDEMTREQLIDVWHENIGDLVDAFIAAGVDPDHSDSTADQIRDVISAWIEAGDECAAC